MRRHALRSRLTTSVGVAVFLTAAGVAAFPSTAAAQVQTVSGAVMLSLPSATTGAIREAGSRGVGWDLIRRNGLTVFIKMKEVFSIHVTALAVDAGRVVRVWSSPSRTVQAGLESVLLPGNQFVPGDQFLLSSPRVPPVTGEQAGTMITVVDAVRAIDAGNVSSFLDRTTATSATGVILVVVPVMDMTSRAAASTTTSPRFLRTAAFGR